MITTHSLIVIRKDQTAGVTALHKKQALTHKLPSPNGRRRARDSVTHDSAPGMLPVDVLCHFLLRLRKRRYNDKIGVARGSAVDALDRELLSNAMSDQRLDPSSLVM